MAENKKMTKRDVINLMLGDVNISNNETYVGYLTHELELLDRKNASGAGLSKTQVENQKICEMLIEELTKIGQPITITDLMNTSDAVKNYVLENGNSLTNQKLSALLNKLANDEKIKKSTDKKKSYFSIISE